MDPLRFPAEIANYAREFRMTYTNELIEHFRELQLGGMCIFGKREINEVDYLVVQFYIGGEEIKVPVKIDYSVPQAEMLISVVIAMHKRLGLDEAEDEDE